MITKDMDQTAVKLETHAEKTAGRVMAAVREASRAMEAEVTAMLELEKAYRQASDAAAELKDSLAANKAAILRVKNAKVRAKKALEEVTKTRRIAARANRDEELKEDRWQAEKTKITMAEQKGKPVNSSAGDKAKREAEESAQKAIAEHENAENARQELMLADAEVSLAENEIALVSTRLSVAREKDEEARREVPKVENITRRALKVAMSALQDAVSTKKTMDLLIKRLKPLVDDEVAKARSANTTDMKAGIQNDEPVEKKIDVPHGLVAGTIRHISGGSDVYSGKVKFLIARPADYNMVKKFQERLMKVEGLRIQSVYGSGSEGTQVTVLVEQPVPLVGCINEMEFVERVFRVSRKEIEVSLAPAR